MTINRLYFEEIENNEHFKTYISYVPGGALICVYDRGVRERSISITFVPGLENPKKIISENLSNNQYQKS